MPRPLVKMLFWVCLWGFFWMGLTFELVDWVKQIAQHNVSGTIQSTEGLNRTKGRVRENLLSLTNIWAGTSVSCLQTWTWAGTYTTVSLCSPACWLQILGLLGLHNYISQCLKINLFVYVCIYNYCYLWIIYLYYYYYFMLYKYLINKILVLFLWSTETDTGTSQIFMDSWKWKGI